jgi:endonuclease-3 related protein
MPTSMNLATMIYRLLLEHFGPQHWWPAETQFEIIVGAVLMPQTSWKNVEAAIGNLKEARMLVPAKIASAPIARLTSLIRPAGLHRTKPRRLKEFCRHIMRTSGGDIGAFLDRDQGMLRRELLLLDGVGPETADSILLYAANKKTFVVDAYTRRVGRRVGLYDFDDYDKVQDYFENNVAGGVMLYQEYHALIVELAKSICRPKPLCNLCPLNEACDYARRSPGKR